MNKSIFNSTISSNILEQAVANVLKSIAIEETALADILNVENEIIQKAKHHSFNLEEFVSVNESVQSVMESISKVQMMTRNKLQYIEKMLHKIENLNETEALEE